MLVRLIVFYATINSYFCERRSREIDIFSMKMTHKLVDIFLNKEKVWMITDLLAHNFEMDLCNRNVDREGFIEMLSKFPDISKIKYRMYNAYSHSTLPIINFTVHLEVNNTHYDVEVSLEHVEGSYQFLYFSLANCHNIKRHENFSFLFLKP